MAAPSDPEDIPGLEQVEDVADVDNGLSALDEDMEWVRTRFEDGSEGLDRDPGTFWASERRIREDELGGVCWEQKSYDYHDFNE